MKDKIMEMIINAIVKHGLGGDLKNIEFDGTIPQEDGKAAITIKVKAESLNITVKGETK